MWATAIWIRTNVSARTPARGRSTILQASVPGENSTTCSGPSPQRSRRVCPFSAETKGIRCRRKRPVFSDSGANFRSIVAWVPSVHRPSDSGRLKPVTFNIRLAAGSEKIYGLTQLETGCTGRCCTINGNYVANRVKQNFRRHRRFQPNISPPIS